MRLFLIAALMAVIGILASSGVVAIAGAEDYVVNDTTAVAMSDAELDAYISDLIDRQYAEILESRLREGRPATAAASN